MKRMLIVAAFLAGCVGDVGEGKVKAEVGEVPVAQPAAGVDEAATQLTIDPARSEVRALGAKVTATHPIVFHAWNGSVALDEDALQGVELEIDVDSLEADHPRLTAHLKKEDFLDVARFPKATFTSASVTPGSDVEGMTHTLTGDLTIRGESRRVTFPANVRITDDFVRAETEFTIDRQDFEVTYPGAPDDLVQDNVVLTIALFAPRA